MSSSGRATIPNLEREWSTLNRGNACFEVAKKMNKLLPHEPLPRGEEGAVEFRILAPMFASRFESSPHWSIRLWLSYLQKGGDHKKRYQYCLVRIQLIHSSTFEQFKVTQGEMQLIQPCRQCDVAKHFRRVHLSRGNFPRPAFHHQIGFDSGRKRCQKGKADGILCSREFHEYAFCTSSESMI